MAPALIADQVFTINQAARSCGMAESTLRYYEQVGVIPPVKRNPSNGYRVYTQRDLDLLDAVACLAAAGMPVADMRAYVANAARGEVGPEAQIVLLEAHRARLAAEARALEARRRYVDLKVAYWQAVAAGDQVEARRVSARARELSGTLRGAAGPDVAR
ncbi:MAG: MerR family transcriptional regulator [Bifidobacteriaceae bacterium]|jgi:DNA-binding transcriptional MerR regulator|nr:MerR family transcriptional regulator [Bifidobacteriaceae bacterium]